MGMGRERVRESKQTEKKHVMVIRDCVSGARALRNLVLGRESRNWRQFVTWGGTSTTLLLLLPSFSYYKHKRLVFPSLQLNYAHFLFFFPFIYASVSMMTRLERRLEKTLSFYCMSAPQSPNG